MKTKIVLMVFISSMAHAVDSSAANSNSTSDLTYCKAPYIDVSSGESGTYGGQCMDGKPSGSGEVMLNDGTKLVGHFKNGLLSGKGTLTTPDGSVYKGNWMHGKRQGRGTYTWAQGSSYVGEWLDDKRHGKGVFTWSNGNRFEGEFRDNKRYDGKYFTSNGRVYTCHRGVCK